MIVKTHALRCNGCGQLSSTRGFTTLKDARSHAQRLGWTRDTGDVDNCGRCSRPVSELQ